MEQENKYTSVFMYQDVSKDDILAFEKQFKYKGKKDLLFILSIVIILGGIVTLFFTSGGIIIILAGLALMLWRLSKLRITKQLKFLDDYEKYLVANAS